MAVLGIETSGRSGSIAVVADQVLLGQVELSATGRRHARTLVPELGQLLVDLGTPLPSLQGIAVSIGPGSFTGLRVGVVCAKTLAYALQKPFIAVDTFLSIANAAEAFEGTLWVIDDALRGDVYAGEYQSCGCGEWQCVSSPTLLSLEDFRKHIAEGAKISGPGASLLQEELADFAFINAEQRNPQAEQIARIGERKFNSGEVSDFWTVEPHYIRRSAAEEKAEEKTGGVR